jgi:hypothetical protein
MAEGMDSFAFKNLWFGKVSRTPTLIILSFCFLYSPHSNAESTQRAKQNTPSANQVMKLGKAMQISFDPKEWFYYQPKFMQTARMGAFQSQTLENVNGFLHTEKSTKTAPDLNDLCKQLVELPLDPTLKNNGKSTFVKIADVNACRITKSDADQNAIQYVFISKTPITGRKPSAADPIRFYTHYLYFYYPKKSTAQAEPLIAHFIQGIGNKK